MKIYYGLNNQIIDVTDICFTQLLKNNIITILPNDIIRNQYFTDPIIGHHKFIYIIKDDTMTAYDSSKMIQIDVTNNDVSILKNDDINNKLKDIHHQILQSLFMNL